MVSSLCIRSVPVARTTHRGLSISRKHLKESDGSLVRILTVQIPLNPNRRVQDGASASLLETNCMRFCFRKFAHLVVQHRCKMAYSVAFESLVPRSYCFWSELYCRCGNSKESHVSRLTASSPLEVYLEIHECEPNNLYDATSRIQGKFVLINPCSIV